MQPVANIVLKIDQLGSSVPRKYVTPAEVMFLVADHRMNANGDPIIDIKPIPDNAEQEAIKSLKSDLAKLEEQQNKLDSDANLTWQAREEQVRRIQDQIQGKQDAINRWENLRAIRYLKPQDERSRLSGIYGNKRISRVYTGAIPILPQTFDEARKIGMGVSAGVESLSGLAGACLYEHQVR